METGFCECVEKPSWKSLWHGSREERVEPQIQEEQRSFHPGHGTMHNLFTFAQLCEGVMRTCYQHYHILTPFSSLSSSIDLLFPLASRSWKSSCPAPQLSHLLYSNQRELKAAERKWTILQVNDLLSYCSFLSKFYFDLATAETPIYKESWKHLHLIHTMSITYFLLSTQHSLSSFTLLPEQPLTL